MKDTKVKICCIKSIEEAVLAEEEGADAIGLVGSMPSGPGIIDDGLIREIAREMKGRVETFFLTSEVTARAIISQSIAMGTNTIQLVDHVPVAELKIIKSALPHINITQVIHVLGRHNIAEAKSLSAYVDRILLDSGNPGLAIKSLGGTGNTHNWAISRQIADQLDVPVFLAGGLNPANVHSAIMQVRPHGVDICSGIRVHDELDKDKLRMFIEAVKMK